MNDIFLPKTLLKWLLLDLFDIKQVNCVMMNDNRLLLLGLHVMLCLTSYCQIQIPKFDTSKSEFPLFDQQLYIAGAKSVKVVDAGVYSDWKRFTNESHFDRKGRVKKRYFANVGWVTYDYTFSESDMLLSVGKYIYQYDDNSRLRKILHDTLTLREFTYKKWGGIQSVKEYKGDTIYSIKKYEYDENSRLINVFYNNVLTKEYAYYKNDSVQWIKAYRNGQLFQFREFEYEVLPKEPAYDHYFSRVERETRTTYSLHDSAPEIDTYHFYFNRRNLLSKIVTDQGFSSINGVSIETVTFNENDQITRISHHLSNKESSGYQERIYNRQGILKKVVWYTNNGEEKTREFTFSYKLY